MRRYGLRDDQWERIGDLLPGREGHVGVTAADNRRFVEAVLYRYRTGMPWRDLPERFGDWKNVHRRFSRCAESGVWEQVFQHLAADADNEYAMIDSSFIVGPGNTPPADRGRWRRHPCRRRPERLGRLDHHGGHVRLRLSKLLCVPWLQHRRHRPGGRRPVL
jgi:transposase